MCQGNPPGHRLRKMFQHPSHRFIRDAIWFWVLLACTSAATNAQNITLQLKNGDRITGHLTLENTNSLTLSNAWAKEIVIPLAVIKVRETNAVTVAVTNAPAKVSSTNAPAVAAKTNATATPVVATAPTKPAKKAWNDWHGDVQVGADVGISEVNRQLYYGRFKITYAPVAEGATPGNSPLIDRFRNTFDYNAAYGRTEGDLSANRMDGSSKTDFDIAIGKRAFVYNLFGAGYDELRQIDFRYEIGPGVGYHLFTRTNFVMNTEVGLNYQAQHLWSKANSLSPREFSWNKRVYYRFAEDITWKISRMLTFDEKLEIFPEVNFDQFRMRFESNLRYWLWQNLSFNLTVLDTYDTKVADNVNRNDLQIRSSVGLKF